MKFSLVVLQNCGARKRNQPGFNLINIFCKSHYLGSHSNVSGEVVAKLGNHLEATFTNLIVHKSQSAAKTMTVKNNKFGTLVAIISFAGGLSLFSHRTNK